MRAIVVLICHDHDGAVPQVFQIRVGLAHVESHDLNQMLQLLIGQNLLSRRVPNIHQLTFQRKDSEPVTSHNLETCDRKSFR